MNISWLTVPNAVLRVRCFLKPVLLRSKLYMARPAVRFNQR